MQCMGDVAHGSSAFSANDNRTSIQRLYLIADSQIIMSDAGKEVRFCRLLCTLCTDAGAALGKAVVQHSLLEGTLRQ